MKEKILKALNLFLEGGKRERFALHVDLDGGAQLIHKLLTRSEPCMISRFGSVELEAVIEYLAIEKEEKWKIDKLCRLIGKGRLRGWGNKDIPRILKNNAGVFSNSEHHLVEFAKTMLACMPNLDVFCTTVDGENLFRKYFPHADLLPLRSLEPYYSSPPWSLALANKKILVVHPYAETIESQYQKHSLLFENKDILPDFELKTIKAIQSIADQEVPFNDWFEALDHMKQQISEIDFDIAIIGCGAYGFPLASYVKDIGKKAVHMGGATQILFGIKGNRWDNHPIISELYNEHWVRPRESDRPQGAEKVEGACYW